ncbi:MAG: hypothetical protein WAK55_25485 [Xanthobacteraceae bacterium]
MMDMEGVRAQYRPQCIATLFVGESPPASGKFFYYGNTTLARNMRAAMTAAGLCNDDDFLERFKANGWYLDDLVLEPVNWLVKSERQRKWLEAQRSLAARIKAYKPRAIVSVLLAIEHVVYGAAKVAGSDAELFAVPFPGMGQQARFREAMAKIVPRLPRKAAER